MLTKPLAYKGPTDHLSQFFELPLLYKATKLLLQELLVDWQDQRIDNQVQGVFLEQGRLIKTQLEWPLNNVLKNSICECHSDSQLGSSSNQRTCIHVAALAVASKMHLERLPQPVRQSVAFESEISYLKNWIAQSNHDPYPPMARHRVIYLLDQDSEGFLVSVHKAYLTQQETYQRKAELDVEVIEKNKLPKFLSLTDQKILFGINNLRTSEPDCRLDSHRIRLNGGGADKLLQQMLESHRCFWQNCHRQALKVVPALSSNVEGEQIINELYLDKSRRFVFDCKMTLSENKRCFLQNGNNGNQQLAAVQQDWLAMEASGDNSEGSDLLASRKNHSERTRHSLVPRLTITSEQIYLPWQRSEPAERTFDIDVAKVSFLIDEQEFSFDELYRVFYQFKDAELVRLLESIAGKVHQLDWVPGLYGHFEQPIVVNYGRVDRYLSGDFSHWFVLFYGLMCEGWQVDFGKNFRLDQKTVESWYSKVGLPEGGSDAASWFELELGVVVDGQSINILPYIVEALKRNQWDLETLEEEVTLTLEDGSRVAVAKQRVQAILNNLIELSDKKPLTQSRLRLPMSQFARLQTLEDQLPNETDWSNIQWLREKAKILSQGQPHSIKIPESVNATLRDYQVTGVAWLQFLRQQKLAGILADDMGLGKTLQTLVHIQLEHDAGRMHAPVMVVAPTSLLGNWVAEANKFVPQLKLVQWYGSDREKKINALSHADVIVTSYGVLLRDAVMLNQLNLHLLVLDEAQTIKNARSKIARIAYAMSAQHRLCLTGTPLENHLGELWSLFHFLMPGFLGDEAQFKRLFRLPIERDNDYQRQQLLSQRIRPFMLRRTKDKVAKDLPIKTEINESIELNESQADLYESVRLSMMEEVQKALNQSSRGGNQLLIGNALLRLRQICCHPQLVVQGNNENVSTSSAKLDWLRTMLPEMIDAKRKILLFSTFTSMLDIIAELLKELGIDYLTLTGKSRKRTSLVEQFQNSEVPVFLISLKAGGAGLNLTAADTVIHFDPWWNPAAENQASDRAHRIGQDKPVFVYKLITRGTVEERINKMQESKQALASGLYEGSAESELHLADWQKLLAPIE